MSVTCRGLLAVSAVLLRRDLLVITCRTLVFSHTSIYLLNLLQISIVRRTIARTSLIYIHFAVSIEWTSRVEVSSHCLRKAYSTEKFQEAAESTVMPRIYI